MAENGNGVWKFLAGMMGSAMLTGVIAWFSFGGGVSADEVRTIISTEAPYTKDKKAIEQSLNTLKENDKRLEDKIDKNDEKTQQKLDDILKRLPRD